jgi:hypothetical protein
MPGQDGSRAISTINFLLVSRCSSAAHAQSWQQQRRSASTTHLLPFSHTTQDDKAPGTKLEHTWNAHLKTACRDDTRGSLNLLNLFTSDCDEPADSTAADPDSSTALQDASAPQDPSPAANSEGPRQQQQQQQQPLPAEAVAGGPAPACSAAAGGAQAAAPSTPAQDAAAAPSTVQEAVNTTAAADGGLAAASCTPQQLSGSSDSKGSGQAEAAPAQQHSSPAPEQPANGVSTVAGPPTSVLNPMQAATGAKPAAESPAPPAQVAEGGWVRVCAGLQQQAPAAACACSMCMHMSVS